MEIKNFALKAYFLMLTGLLLFGNADTKLYAAHGGASGDSAGGGHVSGGSHAGRAHSFNHASLAGRTSAGTDHPFTYRNGVRSTSSTRELNTHRAARRTSAAVAAPTKEATQSGIIASTNLSATHNRATTTTNRQLITTPISPIQAPSAAPAATRTTAARITQARPAYGWRGYGNHVHNGHGYYGRWRWYDNWWWGPEIVLVGGAPLPCAPIIDEANGVYAYPCCFPNCDPEIDPHCGYCN